MIRFRETYAIARAEMRLTRRLVRYWVFLVLSYLIGLVGYLYYAAIHAFFSSFSASVASIGPRYLIGAMGLYYMLIFMIGIIFLGFDLRARDTRERMTEVLDSRPMSNLELVFGRFFGLLIPSWFPVVVLALLFDLLGHVLPALGSPVGEPVARVSLVMFVFVMALPAFAFSLALVFFMTMLVRNRLIAAVVMFVVLGGIFWAVLRLPLYMGPLFDITGAYIVNFPSEVLPYMMDGVGWMQRPAVLLLAFALLGLTAVVHPRLDGGSRSRTVAASVLAIVVAFAMMGTGVFIRKGALNDLQEWRAAHEARLDEPVPNIDKITGKVAIDPGRQLEMTLEVVFHAPSDAALKTVLFTLNPGLEIVAAEQANRAVNFTFENGLLELQPAQEIAAGATGEIKLIVGGEPNILFGYLDSAITPEALMAWQGQIFLLGYDRGVFDSRYVALMPGIRWLPASGPDVGREDTRNRPRDYFDIDLEVSVPEDFLVAGPGRREEISTGVFRFAPAAPLPEVALIASRFESVKTEIRGVTLEVLLDPKHTRNIEVFVDAGPEIKSWIEERFDEIELSGLTYPYGGFSMVEVPNSLRGFGGGWRVDTVMAPPGMALMRESGFPTARFDVPFRKPERFTDREGGINRAKMERLRKFCENDFSGGNPFIGIARNFFINQTSATGEDALALNFVLQELATLTVADSRGYFSAFMFSPEMNKAIGGALQGFFMGGRDRNFAEVVIEVFTSRPEVWSVVESTSLRDLDPSEDSQRSLDILTLKGGALATSLVDELGNEGAGVLLKELRQRFAGRNFELADIMALSETDGIDGIDGIDSDLSQLFNDWLTTTNLPAFVGEDAQSYRLSDSDDGSPRYQLTATVRNDELTQGLFRLVYRIGLDDDRERVESDPIRLAGQASLRFSTVVSKPPQVVWVEPYLSMNRETFRIPMEAVDEDEIIDEEPEEGQFAVDWLVPSERWIAIDDLDEGFVIIDGESGNGVRLGAKAEDGETDEGLPLNEFGPPAAEWSRASSSSAWGKYRHTIAHIKKGKGNNKVGFSTEIPTSGAWDLEIHLPHKQRFVMARNWGTWKLEIDNNDDVQAVEFDASAAPRGWNIVGGFELADGTATVRLSDETTGQIVIADAIRWVPAAGNSYAVEDSE